MPDVKPCVNQECSFYNTDLQNNCHNDGVGNIRKCNAYKPELPKRPITVKELFEAGATCFGDDKVICVITAFDIENNKIYSCNIIVTIEDLNPDQKWTADRKTWHDFLVEDENA